MKKRNDLIPALIVLAILTLGMSSGAVAQSGNISFSYGSATGDFDLNRIRVQASIGYQTSPYFYLGVGTGIYYYMPKNEDGKGQTIIPLFATFTAYFLDKHITPFLDFKMGYSFNGSNEFDPLGVFTEPSIGVRFSALRLSVGYALQMVGVQSARIVSKNVCYRAGCDNYVETVVNDTNYVFYKALTFNIGLAF